MVTRSIFARFAFLTCIVALGLAARPCAAATNTFTFNYSSRSALLSAGWSFNAISNGVSHNTEITSTGVGGVINYDQTAHPGSINVPCDIGYMWGLPVAVDSVPNLGTDPFANQTRNSLFRSLPTNWVSARLSFSFNPTNNFQQVNLVLYQDDDNYLEEQFTYNTFLMIAPFNLAGPTAVGMAQESFGFPYRVAQTYVTSTNLNLRMDRDIATGDVTGFYSSDGVNWIQVGLANQALTNAKIGIVVGDSPQTFPLSALPICSLKRLDIITADNYTNPPPVLVAAPAHLVFNARQDQACTVTQQVNVGVRRSLTSIPWTVSSNASWLSYDTASGSTPGSFNVTVNPAGLSRGTYEGTLSISATGPTNIPQTVSVTLIVNPTNRVRMAPWRDAKPAALTVTADDSSPWGFDLLTSNAVAGTFLMWHLVAPDYYTTYRQAGMELGAHTINHACFELTEPALRHEFEGNIAGLTNTAPVQTADVISLAWPCGFNTPMEQIIASDYFLACRGYNLNQLEDQSPSSFMNLKSYNSHEHSPFPPADFKTVVDAAVAQGKWFNLVLHNTNNDNDAIVYAATNNNTWIAPLGTVAKYIQQRDRIIFTNYSENSGSISFKFYRLPLESTSKRNFEANVSTNDPVTVTIDTTGLLHVASIKVDGTPIIFGNRNGTLFFTTAATTNSRSVLIDLGTNTPPAFLSSISTQIVNELTTMVVTNAAVDSNAPAQAITYSLQVSNTIAGGFESNAQIGTNGIITWTPTEAQGPGTYRFTTIVTDSGWPAISITNQFTVIVNEVNTPPQFSSQPNRTVFALMPMTVNNGALDFDIPVNSVSYALIVTNLTGHVAVTNATIDSSGIIHWTPGTNQSFTTNLFTTIATDNNPVASNSHALSSTNTFLVMVGDTGLSLPAQMNRTTPELVALVVTNTAIIGEGAYPGPYSTNRILFTYSDRNALIADGWSFIGTTGNGFSRDTEITDPGTGVVQFAQTNDATGTVLRVPCDVGDLWGGANDTRNTLFRNLPTNWVSAQLHLAFAPTENYQQAELAFYQDDDNYVEIGRGFNSFSGGQSISFDLETSQNPATLSSSVTTATNLYMRLDRNTANGNISAFFGTTGTSWTSMGSTSQSFTNARLAIWIGGATVPFTSSLLSCDLSQLDLITTNPPVTITYTLAVTNTSNNSPMTNAVINSNGVITWTPTEAQGPGDYVFTTRVTDGTITSVNTFTVTVTEVNVAPVLSTQTNRTIAELSSLVVTNTATDSDIPANTLSYQLINPPAGAAINTNGVITWMPNESQGPSTNTIVTVVTDNGVPPLSKTNSFNVTVTEVNNNAPVLAVQTNRTIAEMTTLMVTNNATDADLPGNPLSYTLVNPPAGAVIDTNGVITWTPGENQGPGTNTITTIVNDNGTPSLKATNSFVVTVTEVNVAPVLAAQTNRTIGELTLLVVTNTATDSDLPANTLSYSLINPPAGAVIDTNGVITWTPDEDQGPGTNTITTVVVDNGQPALSATNSFDVVVTELNVAPILPAQTNVEIAELSLLTVTNTASDSDIPANTLAYQLIDPPTGAVIDTNGVITWTPSENQGPSTNTITTVVTDNGVPPLSRTNSFVVTVIEVNNNGPVLAVQTNRTIGELTLLVVTNTATDGDLAANTLSYSLINPPVGAVIDTNGVITWTPAEDQGPGTNTITTVVVDNGQPALSATNSFDVVVTEVNIAPTLPAQTNVAIAELSLLTVTNTASDSDIPANTLAYQLIDPPTGAVIDTNGVITWTPSENQGSSTFTLTTVVTDNGMPPLSSTNSFDVTVSEVNVAPVLPAQTNLTVAELTLLIVTNTAGDADVPANVLTYQLIDPPTGAVVDTNGVITWTPEENQGPGAYTITTVVTDNGLPPLSATNSFDVTVTEVNSAPIATGGNVTTPEETATNLVLIASDADVPTNTLTFSIDIMPTNGVLSNFDTNAGSVTYTPNLNYNGSDHFTFTVSDGSLTATGQVSLTVTPINDAPVAQNDNYETHVGTTLTITAPGVLANDSDVDLNSLTAILDAGPSFGVLNLNSNGSFDYTPTNGFSGSDSFTYQASDGLASSAPATVTINVANALQITSIQVSNNLAVLTWTSVIGRTYRLEYVSDLAATNWTAVVPDFLALGSTTTGVDLSGVLGNSGGRFYRVKLLP